MEEPEHHPATGALDGAEHAVSDSQWLDGSQLNLDINTHLIQWTREDTFVCFCREDLYGETMAESIVTPPLLIVFYKRHSNIDPMWHVRHLGEFGSTRASKPQAVDQIDFTCGHP